MWNTANCCCCCCGLRNQATGSRAAQLHFYATGHRLIFLWLLPPPPPPTPHPYRLSTPTPTTSTRYDYFSPCSGAPLYSRSAANPPPLHTVIFHAVFFAGAGAALHICTASVQYVKEANICSVQSVISIYLFSLLGELLFFSGA